jgi:hypothetical protein
VQDDGQHAGPVLVAGVLRDAVQAAGRLVEGVPGLERPGGPVVYGPLVLALQDVADLTTRLERLQAKSPGRIEAQPLFAISGLNSDLQRVYAIEWVLMCLETRTGAVQAEVAAALWDLVETSSMTYKARESANRAVLRPPSSRSRRRRDMDC